MTRASVREYLATQRARDRALPPKERGRLLDEIVAVTGYHRKAVIRALRELPRRRVGSRPVGRPRRYGAEVGAAAQVLWEAAGQIGAKRLHPFVAELLERLTAYGELRLPTATAELLRRASLATLERLLAPARRLRPRRGATTTQPGTWLKQQIPMRTFAEWDDARPGFLEVDLVAHCGARAEGFFLYTLCAVDVATSWVELVYPQPGLEEKRQRACRAENGALVRHLIGSIATPPRQPMPNSPGSTRWFAARQLLSARPTARRQAPRRRPAPALARPGPNALPATVRVRGPHGRPPA